MTIVVELELERSLGRVECIRTTVSDMIRAGQMVVEITQKGFKIRSVTFVDGSLGGLAIAKKSKWSA